MQIRVLCRISALLVSTIDLLALLYANPSVTMPLTYFATTTLVQLGNCGIGWYP